MAVPEEKTLGVVLEKMLQQQRQMFPSAGHLESPAMEKKDGDEFHTSDTPGRRLDHTQHPCESCRTGDGGSPLDRTRCSLRAAALSRTVSLLRMQLARRSLAEEEEASSLQSGNGWRAFPSRTFLEVPVPVGDSQGAAALP